MTGAMSPSSRYTSRRRSMRENVEDLIDQTSEPRALARDDAIELPPFLFRKRTMPEERFAIEAHQRDRRLQLVRDAAHEFCPKTIGAPFPGNVAPEQRHAGREHQEDDPDGTTINTKFLCVAVRDSKLALKTASKRRCPRRISGKTRNAAAPIRAVEDPMNADPGVCTARARGLQSAA